MKPHRATTILVLGILGLIMCAPLGIAAWVMGNKDLKDMDAGLMDPSGRSNTNAGRICGMIAGILMAVAAVIWVVLIVIGIAGATLSSN